MVTNFFIIIVGDFREIMDEFTRLLELTGTAFSFCLFLLRFGEDGLTSESVGSLSVLSLGLGMSLLFSLMT
jgi:hypothetical protein